MNETEPSHGTLLKAWLASERNLAASLAGGGWKAFCKQSREISERGQRMTDAYYSGLHSADAGYRQNNWLLDRIEEVKASGARTVTELGAGNCRFSTAIATFVDKVYAVDWALTPADVLPENVVPIQADARRSTIPPADLVCSADFLEHVPPEDLPSLVMAASEAAPAQMHVIACYDDGHSHLTIMPPGAWLALFREVSDGFGLSWVTCRRDDPRQVVCVVKRSYSRA